MLNFLLAVDGSACSLRAVDHLISRLSWYREVPTGDLLYVHPPIPDGRVQRHLGHETLERYYREDSVERLEAAEAKLKAAGVAYQRHIHVGQPGAVIAHQAAELGADLVLLGSHGWSAIAGAVMGSVATRVVHETTVPVLLVK